VNGSTVRTLWADWVVGGRTFVAVDWLVVLGGTACRGARDEERARECEQHIPSGNTKAFPSRLAVNGVFPYDAILAAEAAGLPLITDAPILQRWFRPLFAAVRGVVGLRGYAALGPVGLGPSINGLTTCCSRWLPIDPGIVCAASDYVARQLPMFAVNSRCLSVINDEQETT
jgi:hypothetical protein